MKPFILEASWSRGEGGHLFVYVLCGIAVTAGIWLAVSRHSLTPILGSALGVLGYAWLLRQPFSIHYEPYLTINSQGIEYVHSLKPPRRTARYAWSEISHLSVALAADGHEVQGLNVFTNRPRMSNVPILLQIPGDADCLAALATAQGFLNGLDAAQSFRQSGA